MWGPVSLVAAVKVGALDIWKSFSQGQAGSLFSFVATEVEGINSAYWLFQAPEGIPVSSYMQAY